MTELRQGGSDRRRWAIGLAVFGASASLPAAHLILYQDRPWAILALAGLMLAAYASIADRHVLAAGAIIATSLFLQLAYIGVGYSDQIDLGRLALGRVLDGLSPYGVMYENQAGGSNPFGYGPLAMLTATGGTSLELIASGLLLTTVAVTRSWITLCVVAGFPPYVFLAPTGINDYSVALLLTLGWLAVRSRPKVGMLLLASAAAIKPYVAAWFPAVLGYAGWSAGVWLLAASAGFWWPVAIWGIGSYVESLRLVALAPAPPGWASNTIPIPWIRLMGVPVALAGVLAHHWSAAILIGSLGFAMVLFFGEWASLGYWVALLPISGIALERALIARQPAGEASRGSTSELSTPSRSP